MVSVSAETENVVSVTAVTEKSGFGQSLVKGHGNSVTEGTFLVEAYMLTVWNQGLLVDHLH